MLEVVAAIGPRCALLISYASDDILVATSPDHDRLAAFEASFPEIDWEFRNGEHAWPADTLADAMRWSSTTGAQCPG
jgi:hypothetical protein